MPSLIQGRIVYAKVPIPDPQGGNPKANRPFVIISHSDDIKAGNAIHGVAITSEAGQSPEDCYVVLPTGHALKKHGLKEGSTAVCNWVETLNPAVLEMGGFLEPRVVREIILKVRKLKPGVFQLRALGEPTK